MTVALVDTLQSLGATYASYPLILAAAATESAGLQYGGRNSRTGRLSQVVS